MTFALARLAEFEPQHHSEHTRVVFVSAGPGDPDLLTIKGRRTIAQADVIVYAGSLVPREILQHASPTAELHDSAPLTLEEVMERLIGASRQGKRVVRIHSGDTSLYSAMQEQMTRLDEAGIEYDVIPGVSSFQAAAAALKAELTLPEIAQTVILTRTEGETRMPEGEAANGFSSTRLDALHFLERAAGRAGPRAAVDRLLGRHAGCGSLPGIVARRANRSDRVERPCRDCSPAQADANDVDHGGKSRRQPREPVTTLRSRALPYFPRKTAR